MPPSGVETAKANRGLRRFGYAVWIGLSLVALGGGIALLVYAAGAASTEPHHGQAVDGLDGLGNFVALIAGAAGIALVAGGGLNLRAAARATRRA